MSDKTKDRQQEALDRAHQCLSFLGTVKMLAAPDGPLDAWMLAVAISCAEIWASGEKPKPSNVGGLLNTGAADVYPAMKRLLNFGPPWKGKP